MKSQYTAQLMFILLFTLFQNRLTAQCDHLIIPAYSCEDAQLASENGGEAFICGVEEFCLDASEVPVLNPPPPFCTGGSVLNNPMWIAFIGDDSGLLDLEVISENCNGGIQWALYDQCGDYFNSVACESNPVLPPNQPFYIISAITPGQKYYLVIDGANGATCLYRFKVNSGMATESVAPATDTTLTGPLSICPGEKYTYTMEGFDFSSKYQWFLNGVLIGSSVITTTEVTMPQDLPAGLYDLCVKGSNSCDISGQELCWTVEITQDKTLDVKKYVCEGDSILFQNAYYQPGNYFLPYEGSNGCYLNVNLTVENNYIPQDTLYNIIVCATEDSLLIGDKYYKTNQLYENEIVRTLAGCDYNASFYIDRVNSTDAGINAVNDTIPCDHSELAVLTFEGNIISGNPKITETYEWYDASGKLLVIEPSLVTDEPGTYFLRVKSIFENPTDLQGIDDQYSCITYLQHTVVGEEYIYQNPVIINADLNPQDYDFFLKIDNYDEFPEGTEFQWILPQGVNLVENTNEIIHFFIIQAGTYDVCVYASGECNTTDTVCFEVKFNTISTDGLSINNAINLRNNPVSNQLIFDINAALNKDLTIEIFNVNGAAINTEKIRAGSSEHRMDVNNLTSGFYFYRINATTNQAKSGKFIKI